MNFKTSQQGGATVIELDGNLLGGPDAGLLKNKLRELVESGKKQIVVDLHAVEFMNSSGLAMLINALTTMKSAGGGLKIANASEKIAALIKVTKLSGMFENYTSVADAAAAFKK